MKKLFRYVAVAAVTGLAVSGAAAGASSGNIDTTGPDSHNVIEFENEYRTDVDNHNNVSGSNNNPQSASSGDAKVYKNTTGGDAGSGAASNESSLSADISIDNSGSTEAALASGNGAGDDSAEISNTGPDSYNKVEFENEYKTDVENHNTLSFSNTNTQSASTGNATVSRNTTGGDATSGDASNTSSVDIVFSVTN